MRRSSHQQQRGSLSVLSVLWLAVTFTGVWVIGHATVLVQQRAFVQESADSIALAAAIGGASAANALEDILHVTVMQLELTEGGAVVTVRAGQFTATSSASQSG